MTALESAKLIARTLDDKKAQEVRVLGIGGLTTIGEYFVIATGGSTVQTKALADAVEERLEKEGLSPRRCEGYQSANWILLDFQQVIVHIFDQHSREFYSIERLWADAPVIDWEQ